jgi:hypothetical protein
MIMFCFIHNLFILIVYDQIKEVIKGVIKMASKQLIELVNGLKKSGIQISFTKPRSKISLFLQEPPDNKKEYGENSLQHKHNGNKKLAVLKFV